MKRLPQTRSLLIPGLVVLALLGLNGCQQGHHLGKSNHMEMMINMISYKLEFTDEQKSKFEAIKDQLRAIRAENKDVRDQQKKEFKDLILAPEFDTEKATAVMDTRHQMMMEYRDPIMASIAELHATLTPEQKSKIVNRLEKEVRKH